ncbi:retrotransposon gag domain-containing protein, partial [Escherichia coli]|uniref:retrotransposon gag domain-containing protein n=1 Tax=Escherichia coli TaxID=562 RepID=UPI00200FC87B
MKQAEFDALRQDNLSVLEYEHKFNQLVRYAPQYHGLEELKAKRFVRGLKSDIRKAVRPFGAVTYYEAVQKALLVEQKEYKTRYFPSGPGESSQVGGKQKKPPHG